MGLLRMRRGEVFGGQYEVKKLLAEGGMGMIYAVHDQGSGEMRALKVLLPELVANERTRKRFSQEAKVAMRIDHPAIPKIFGVGIDSETGVPFIAMELLDGVDLRDHVDNHGAIPIAEAKPILLQVCAALAAAHREGIVHRDLKPENVFLQTSGETPRVKLLDFGIIKELDPHQTSAPGTGAIGSPMWMAPEQTSAGGRIAPATDCWALGLLSFYVLTGKLYWKAAHDESGVSGLLRELHLDDLEPPSVRAMDVAPDVRLPRGFDAFFERATARDSKERFKDASEAIGALEVALSGPGDEHDGAFAATLEVHRDELVPRSQTSPMGSGADEDGSMYALGPGGATLREQPSPVRGLVPETSQHLRLPPKEELQPVPLPAALAPTEALRPAEIGTPAPKSDEERIPNTDPPEPLLAPPTMQHVPPHPAPPASPYSAQPSPAPIRHAPHASASPPPYGTPAPISPPSAPPHGSATPPTRGVPAHPMAPSGPPGGPTAAPSSPNLVLWLLGVCLAGLLIAVLTALVVWGVLTMLS